MAARSRISRIVSTLVGVGVLGASLCGLRRAPASLGEPLACTQAQLTAGELRCDAELLEELRELCEAAPAGVEVGPGDAIEARACVCAVYPALRELGSYCPPSLAPGRMPPEQLAALHQVVDLNAASVAELASLPGIGPTLAKRIVAGRPYAKLDELLEVRGIGPKRLAAIRARARLDR